MNAFLRISGVAALCLISAFIGGAVSHDWSVSWRGDFDISYPDLIAIILTALGVIITVMAIFLAILSVFGWTSISNGVRARATEYLTSEFGEGGALREMVRTQVDSFIYSGVGDSPEEEEASEGSGQTGVSNG